MFACDASDQSSKMCLHSTMQAMTRIRIISRRINLFISWQQHVITHTKKEKL